MLDALILIAMVSLSKAEKDAYFEKSPQNTLHDCGSAPQPYGECRLPPDLGAAQIQSRLAGKDTAWWREGDEFVVVARRDTDQAYLCCAARGRMDRIEGDLWALRLRIVDLDAATIDVSVRPSLDAREDVYRGPAAPPAPVFARTLRGRVHVEEIASHYLDAPRDIAVYVPPDFDPAKSYPSLYLADGDQRLGTPFYIEPLILSGALPPMIIVELWSGSSPSDADLRSEEYLLGWPNGTAAFHKHEDFVLHEVVPYVEKNFAAASDPQKRVVSGFSSGAAWAISMGIRHPDIFQTVIAQSLVWNDGRPSSNWQLGMTLAHPTALAGFSRSTSSGEFTRDLGASHITRFYLSAGTLEPRFYEETLHFAGQARQAGHETLLESTVSGHTETIWRPLLVHALEWAFSGKAPYARQ